MRRRTFRSAFTLGCRALGVTLALWAGAACHEPLDTARQAPPKATLGDDLYGVMCDRVGASSLAEDLTGASYQALCHHDAEGRYADAVDTSRLPPARGPEAEEARRLALAKLQAMARRRADFIRAINAAFPDVEVDNAATEADGDKIRLHDALLAFSQDIAALYDTNPYQPGGEPVLPASTRGLGRMFDALARTGAEPGEGEAGPADKVEIAGKAREALAKIQGREGYRPTGTALGAIRAALSHPGLRELGRTSTEVIGPGGTATAQLDQLLAVVKQELATAKANVSALPPLAVDAATAQPSRPRSNIEVLRALLLREDSAFAAEGVAPSYIVARDRRGFALTALGAPFVDADGDGLADVDPSGRFVDAAGAPLALDPPFAVPGLAPASQLDPFGRPVPALYSYIDTTSTLGAALARTVLPLVDPVQYGAPGDPEGWQREHESLMYALSGAYLLYGDREPAVYDHESEQILLAGETCARCTPYQRFRGEDSPLADLAHATGQLLADPESDALLLGLRELLVSHEDAVARLVGAALRVREIAAEHDELARQGKEPRAEIPYEAPIWDEMAEIIGKISDRPGMTVRLLQAFADPRLVEPIPDGPWGPGVRHVGDTMARQFRYRDEMSYNPEDINGPTINVTLTQDSGLLSFADPQTPVDMTQPRAGKNRSIMQRSLQIIHDAHGATACNKQDAELYVGGFKSGSIGIRFDECQLFQFDNIATFYVDSMLPDGHPKKSEIEIKDGAVGFILDVAEFFGISVDGIFEDGSGIEGLTLMPTTPALNRLVFFGADSAQYPGLPDLDPFRGEDELNEGTNQFISSLIEPASASVCPKNANGASECPTGDDLLRIRGRNTIFIWERMGFLGYLQPMVTAFADEPCADGEGDDCGEVMFADIVRVLNRHWPGPEHGPECSKTGAPLTNPAYCSEAGVNTYEPLAADAVETDLIPALVEFSRVVSEVATITVQRGPSAGEVWTAAEVLDRMTRITFSQDYAASVGMADRKGSTSTTWTDGTPQPQLTLFSLFADALHRIDQRFDASEAPDAEARKGQWKRARSQIVDAIFAVEGEGPEAHFKNPAAAKLLVAGIDLMREQLNANCPDREATGQCTWAKEELGKKMAETLSGPLFASLMDVKEALRAHEPARRELGRLLSYLLDGVANESSFQATLASLIDILQVVESDDVLAPILKAASAAASPGGDPEGAGAVATAIPVLKALTDDKFDRYHVIDHVMPALVTPMDGGKGPAPVEVILDVIAEVNRIDADAEAPLAPEDYAQVFGTVHDFLTDRTRGLEQFYFIVQNRHRE